MGMASWADITGTIYYDVPVCKEEDKDIDDIYEPVGGINLVHT